MVIPRTFQGNYLGSNPYASAQIWGSGVDPIHATRDGQGRNIAPDGVGLLVDPELTDYDSYGYADEDMATMQSGDAEGPFETGTADRPGWAPGDVDQMARGHVTKGWPGTSEGDGDNGGPASGEYVRSLEHGAIASNTPTGTPWASAAAGYEGKMTDGVIEPGSGISNPSQYTMQTSMQQLRRARQGSQNSGSQSPYNGRIESRVPGQKVAGYSQGPGSEYRHIAMRPFGQSMQFRPFWNRTAGTGIVSQMRVNAVRQVTPLNRDAPPDPYQGPSISTITDPQTYGYAAEDAVW